MKYALVLFMQEIIKRIFVHDKNEFSNDEPQQQQVVKINDYNHNKNELAGRYAVKVSNVSFNYGKNQFIDNFNMQVQCSSIYCLIGNSGAGKKRKKLLNIHL